MISPSYVIELWERRHEPAAAVAMLAIVEKCRTNNKPVPRLIARWYSQAIDRMLNVTQRPGEKIEHARWEEYGRALGMIQSDNRPMKYISTYFVATVIAAHKEAYSEAAIRDLVITEFGVSKNTALKTIRSIKQSFDECDMLRETSK